MPCPKPLRCGRTGLAHHAHRRWRCSVSESFGVRCRRCGGISIAISRLSIDLGCVLGLSPSARDKAGCRSEQKRGHAWLPGRRRKPYRRLKPRRRPKARRPNPAPGRSGARPSPHHSPRPGPNRQPRPSRKPQPCPGPRRRPRANPLKPRHRPNRPSLRLDPQRPPRQIHERAPLRASR